MSKEQLEIDFLDTGKGSGDAIAVRYGDFDSDDFKVIIIDAGYQNTGEKLATFIDERYGTKKVNLAICSHPDRDHAAGFVTAIEMLDVSKIWINLPTDFAEDLIEYADDRRMTINSLSKDLTEKYPYVSQIIEVANDNDISMYKLNRNRSFDNGTFKVLSPTDGFIKEMLRKSNKTKLFLESVEVEDDKTTLGGETAPENEMSGVILFQPYKNKYLFTADAGIEALNFAIDYCESQSISLTDLTWFQVPHHGSRRNINEDILDKIKAKTAYISAAKGDPKHPSDLVVNALDERGFSVYTTEGSNLRHSVNGSNRPDYSKAKPVNDKE